MCCSPSFWEFSAIHVESVKNSLLAALLFCCLSEGLACLQMRRTLRGKKPVKLCRWWGRSWGDPWNLLSTDCKTLKKPTAWASTASMWPHMPQHTAGSKPDYEAPQQDSATAEHSSWCVNRWGLLFQAQDRQDQCAASPRPHLSAAHAVHSWPWLPVLALYNLLCVVGQGPELLSSAELGLWAVAGDSAATCVWSRFVQLAGCLLNSPFLVKIAGKGKQMCPC
jgi:hypothetical protein